MREATRMLQGARVTEKNEMLHARGVTFAKVPSWQRRGTGVGWETYEKDGRDPRTDRVTKTSRRRLLVDEALPMKAAYDAYVRARLR